MLEDKIKETVKSQKIRLGSNKHNEILKEVNYFKNNESKMKYKIFESKGYPIGSGVIEGACKHLVQMRLKRNGMKWSIQGAHDILQLRCLYLSGRWNEVEEMICGAVA